MSDLKQWIRTFASALAVVCAALPSTGAIAAPPVPFYPTHVISVSKISNGSVVIKTKDSVDSVAAWYRINLQDQNREHASGSHIHFFTHNGATVDVGPGNPFEPGTNIGLVWDEKKYGPYTGPANGP
jgi:hypothetical protein